MWRCLRVRRAGASSGAGAWLLPFLICLSLAELSVGPCFLIVALASVAMPWRAGASCCARAWLLAFLFTCFGRFEYWLLPF